MTNKTEDRFYFGKPGQPERFGYSYRFANILADDLDLAISEIQKDMKQMTQVMQKAVKKNPLDTGWIFDTNAYSNRLLDFIDRARGVLKHKDARVQAKAKKAVAEVRAFIDKWDKMEERAQSGKAPFSRPGQPERFGLEDACWEGYEPVGTKQKDGRTVPNCVPKDKNEQPEEFAAQIVSKRGAKRTEIKRDAAGKWAAVLIQSNPTGVPGERADEQVLDMKWYATEANARTAAQKMLSARPGEKEKFSNGDRNRRLMQVLADADRQIANKVVSNIAKNYGIGTLQVFAEIFDSEAEDLMDYVTEPVRSSAFAILQKKGMMSRPGSPDKFDASSLERGSFAEASKSPMLGKLLSEKVMPEGGWRAVQVGSDTLVISFEDADLARDFGRRASTKGYSATSPVATTGRYWNVEVKNG